LGACAFGVIATPLGYILIGALGNFAPLFSMISLPPTLASIAYLFYLGLRRAEGVISLTIATKILAVFALITILGFVYVISNFTLLRPLERLGILAQIFLAASICLLPVVIWRHRGALLSSVAHLPIRASATALGIVLAIAIFLSVAQTLRAPAFI
jgi:hypothetical protein